MQHLLAPQNLSSDLMGKILYLVCGLGDTNHKGHPPMAPNKITNRKLYLDVATLENVAAMAAANITPAQAASLTRIKIGELFTAGQIAYV